MNNLYFNCDSLKRTHTTVVLFSFFICTIWQITHTHIQKKTKILLKNKKKTIFTILVFGWHNPTIESKRKNKQPKWMDGTKIKFRIKIIEKCIAEQ